MRVDLRLERLQLRLLAFDVLDIHAADQILNVLRHDIKSVGNLPEFVIPREADALLEVAFLEGADQRNDSRHFASGQAGDQQADTGHNEEADGAHGEDDPLHFARVLVQVGRRNDGLDVEAAVFNRLLQGQKPVVHLFVVAIPSLKNNLVRIRLPQPHRNALIDRECSEVAEQVAQGCRDPHIADNRLVIAV
ncbi:hypothetical protein D3C71_1293840 [compost metagenome]